MPAVSIIVLNWNGGAKDCLEAVESALAQDFKDREIIFVDNGSTDDSFAAVKAAHPELIFLDTGENLGCPEGRNRGAAIAKGEILFFLENDGVWHSTTVVSGAMGFLMSHPEVGALYTQVTGFETDRVDPPLDKPALPDEPTLASAFRGGASAVRRALYLELGGFPAAFFRQAEERYLSLRIYDSGSSVVYWPLESMAHKGSDYPGKSDVVPMYTFRNTLLVVDRLYPRGFSHLMVILHMGVNFVRFARRRAMSDYFRAFREMLQIRGAMPEHRRVSFQTVRFVRTLRNGPTQPL